MHGTLSTAEYQEFFHEQQIFKGIGPDSSTARLERTLSDCRHGPGATPLLRGERASCTGTVQAFLSEHKLDLLEPKCKSRSALDQRLTCLIVGYRQMHVGFQELYRSDRTLVRAVVARGLSRNCASALGAVPKELTTESRLVKDLATLVSTLEQHNAVTFERATGHFITDAAGLQSDGKSYPLTVCPHQ